MATIEPAGVAEVLAILGHGEPGPPVAETAAVIARLAGSRPSASAGRVSVPTSKASSCSTISGSGTAPLARAKTRNGATSGVVQGFVKVARAV
jgi:hypothetical protein